MVTVFVEDVGLFRIRQTLVIKPRSGVPARLLLLSHHSSLCRFLPASPPPCFPTSLLPYLPTPLPRHPACVAAWLPGCLAAWLLGCLFLNVVLSLLISMLC